MNGEVDLNRRFGGISRLYGDTALEKLSRAHVCVIGVGGVGSWATEALARSGVGTLTLIDMDHVAESNMNRQLQALESSLGKSKIAVLAERCRQINPAMQINLVDEFISPDNQSRLISTKMDAVIDCIDDSRAKAALINYCREKQIMLVTTGGAGGKRDPGRIRLSDLSRTEQDPLLARTRSLLRKQYFFPRDTRKKFKIPCIWSDERPLFQWQGDQFSHQRPNTCSNSSLNCGGLGSSMPVTATFGNMAAAYVIDSLGKH